MGRGGAALAAAAGDLAPPRLAAALLLAGWVAGCGSSPPGAPAAGPVPPGTLAVCAGKPIVASQVAEVAASQRVSTREALDRLADDARAATAAEKAGLDRTPEAQLARQALLARALLSELRRESNAEPTAAELTALRTERWLDFDRPAGVRVVHAVAMVANDATAETAENARKVAESVAEATRDAHDEASFKEKAGQVLHPGVELRIESLPPVARDGRVLDPATNRFDDAFVVAAFQLEKPGAVSGAVRSSFGYHVILLLEQQPAFHLPDDEMRQVAREELAARRGNVLLKSLLESRKASEQVEISRSAAEALAGLDARQAPR
jgi:hypothetical protein